MKKLLLVSIILLATTLSNFAQGYVVFESGSGKNWTWIYNETSGSAYPSSGNLNVAFLVSLTSATPAVDSLGTSTPTNTYNLNIGFSTANAWQKILTDPNFILATNSAAPGLPAVTATLSNPLVLSGFAYSSGTSFPVANCPSGTWTVFAIAWSADYATPQAAAGATGALGWSAAFTYTAGVDRTSTPPTFGNAGLQPFGVAVTPEPGTLTLAGLGMVSLLAFRRRNRK